MLPEISEDLLDEDLVDYELDEDYEQEEVEEEELFDKTYKLDSKNKRISGYCEGIEAIKQAIYKIVNTSRYKTLIYSENYGLEKDDLIGMNLDEAGIVLEDRFYEALTEDERIYGLLDFEIIKIDKKSAVVNFTAVTEQGDIEIEMEVDMNV